MWRSSVVSCAAICLAVAPGCTTAASIDSAPRGALIAVDGRRVADVTPTTIEVSRRFLGRGTTTLELTLDGYEPYEAQLQHVRDDKCFSETLVLTTFGIVFFPLLGAALALPWCTEFEHEVYDLPLTPTEPEETLGEPAA